MFIHEVLFWDDDDTPPPLLGRFVVKRPVFCLTYMLNEDFWFRDES
jgi:hypothetical protein